MAAAPSRAECGTVVACRLWEWQEMESGRGKHKVTRADGEHQTHDVRGTTCYDSFFFPFIIRDKVKGN